MVMGPTPPGTGVIFAAFCATSSNATSLPFERKTKERLAEPGGNLDRERFYEEIILPYRNNQDLIYGQYDCSCGAITTQESIPQQPVIIVEGSYCLHPLMQDAYDIKVFSTCSSELQSQRIRHRNGEQMHHRFLNAGPGAPECFVIQKQ